MAKKQPSKPVYNQKTTATIQHSSPEPAIASANEDVIVIPSGINNYLGLAGCLVLTFVIFANVLGAGFVNWDDQGYIWLNKLIQPISGSSLYAMFTDHTCGNYSPLVVLTYSIEHLFDKVVDAANAQSPDNFNPFIYHLDNVLLHLGSTALAYFFFRAIGLKDWGLLFATALFGIHPMRVESVAWVTERKDVLYGVFYIAALLFYWRYIKEDANKTRNLLLTAVFGLLAYFSKIQAVALPLTMLVMDYYADRKLTDIKVLGEKIPFFAASLLFGLVGVHFLGIAGGFEETGYSLLSRLFFATYSLTMYLVRVFLPINLSTFYPYPKEVDIPLTYYITPFVVAAVGYGVWYSTRFTKAVAFGFLFFLVNIFMLLQFKGAGKAFVADRFTYIPYIGLFFILAHYFQQMVDGKWLPSLQKMALIFAIGFVSVCSILTFMQNKTWLTSVNLWDNVTKNFPNDALSWTNKGLAYDDETKRQGINEADKTAAYEGAIAAYSEAMKVDNNYFDAPYNKAVALFNLKRYPEAVTAYNEAIKVRVNNPKEGDRYKEELAQAYYSRGLTYSNMKDLPNTLKDYQQAIAVGYKGKEDGEIERSIGAAYESAGQHAEAIKYYDQAITKASAKSLNGQLADYHYMKGNSFAASGDMTNAIVMYDKAISFKVDYVDAINNKGNALASMGKPKEALPFFDKAIQLKPDAPSYYANRGLARKAAGDMQGACADWQKSVSLGNAGAQALLQQCK